MQEIKKIKKRIDLLVQVLCFHKQLLLVISQMKQEKQQHNKQSKSDRRVKLIKYVKEHKKLIDTRQ